MRSHTFQLASLVLAAALAGAQAHAADDQVMTSGRVKFVSGGVGDDSNARMQALGKEFNLRLLFAAKDGHYLADVAVAIADFCRSRARCRPHLPPALNARYREQA